MPSQGHTQGQYKANTRPYAKVCIYNLDSNAGSVLAKAVNYSGEAKPRNKEMAVRFTRTMDLQRYRGVIVV